MKNFLIIVAITILISANISAQSITNVIAKQEGNTAVIAYNLQCDEDVEINLFYSDNNGNTFKGPLKKVTGDVGSSISSGNKKIIWNTLQEQEMLAGDKIIFRVIGTSSNGIFSDKRDNKKYRTVRIGKQIFLAENLSYKPSSGNFWVYGDDQINAEKYGYLYDWETAKNVCPDGWHLTSDEEWTILSNTFGGDKLAGGKLKEKGTTHWSSPNADATNESGFTALPGGYRFRAFYNIEHYGYWWTSTERNATNAWFRYLVNTFSNSYRDFGSKSNGCSVRCVKN